MADKILLLSVDGGEVETFIGAFRSRASLDEKLAEERDGGGWTVEEGYVTAAPEVNSEGVECIYIHPDDSEPYDFSLVFLIREVEVID